MKLANFDDMLNDVTKEAVLFTDKKKRPEIWCLPVENEIQVKRCDPWGQLRNMVKNRFLKRERETPMKSVVWMNEWMTWQDVWMIDNA